jgi:hypothetical protein
MNSPDPLVPSQGDLNAAAARLSPLMQSAYYYR